MDEQKFPIDDLPEPKKQQEEMGRRRFLETGVWATTGVVGLTLFGTGGRFIVGDALKNKDNQWVPVGEVASLSAGQMHQTAYSQQRMIRT